MSPHKDPRNHTPLPHCSRKAPAPSSPLSKKVDSAPSASDQDAAAAGSSLNGAGGAGLMDEDEAGETVLHQPKPMNGKSAGKRRAEPYFIPMPNSSRMVPNDQKKPINLSTLSPLPSPLPFFGGTIVFLPAPPPSNHPTPSSTHPSSPHHAPPIPLIVPASGTSTPGLTPAQTPPPTSHIPPSSLSLRCHARARIPTPHGAVFLHLYKTAQDRKEHLAIVFDPAQIDSSTVEPGHIRSRSLDAVWREGETEMERLVRGAYVGRLSEKGGKASTGKERLVEGFEESRPPTPAIERSNPNYNTPSTTPLSSPPTTSPPAEHRQLNPALIRIHSECFTGETIGSQRCDCGEQLDESLRIISLPTPAPTSSSSSTNPSQPTPPLPGRGVIVYLRQEGRGIGLLSKLLAYNLQDLGHDTVSANIALGHGADERKWDVAGGILRDLGFGTEEGGEGVRLMTNNPDKVEGLRGEGIKVVERVGMVPRAWPTYPHRDLRREPMHDEEGEFPEAALLSESLDGQLHPEIKALEKEARQTDREKREWLARKGGIGMIGGGETRSPELDRYLRTKVEQMGHILELPKDA